MESCERLRQPVETAGLLWSWWKGDPLPELPALSDFAAGRSDDLDVVAHLAQLPSEEATARVEAGHRPYVARVEARPVGYGWVATREAAFSGQRVRFQIPESDMYLWDFATLPEWRGRSIYPRLLQAIVMAEAARAERFWILHQMSNTASARGIAKAGFQVAGRICFLADGGLVVLADDLPERAHVGAALLGLPLIESELYTQRNM